jgi:hypothetical protein
MGGLQPRFPGSDSYNKPYCDRDASVTFSPNEPRIIKIEAFEIDTIQFTGPKSSPDNETKLTPGSGDPEKALFDHVDQLFEAGTNMRQWYNNCKALARQHSSYAQVSSELVDQEVWNMCMMNERINQTNVVTQYDLFSREARIVWEYFIMAAGEKFTAETFANYLEDLKINPANGGQAYYDGLSLHGYLTQRIVSTAIGRRFCITSKGSLTLVPALTEKGDLLVYVRREYLPSLLRPTAGTELRAQWVGTAHVHEVPDIARGIDVLRHMKEWTIE